MHQNNTDDDALERLLYADLDNLRRLDLAGTNAISERRVLFTVSEFGK